MWWKRRSARRNPERIPNGAREVLSYFVRNPQAADSVEGIARWRLRQEAIERTLEEVNEALGWLAQQGYVLQESAAGGPPIFRLNLTRVIEAEQFLNGPAPAVDAAAPQSRVTVPDPRGLIGHICTWLDATLLRHHRRTPRGGSDLPGLTKSHAVIEQMLESHGPTASEGADGAAADLLAAFGAADPAAEPCAALYRQLELSPLELQAVLLCLAPELDSKYQSVYGVFNDDLGRRAMTLGLLCTLLGEPSVVRATLARSAGLTAWRLFEHGIALPYADEPLRVDPVIVAWLLGDDQALINDRRLLTFVRSQPWAGANWMRRSEDITVVEHLAELLSHGDDEDWIALTGEDCDGWRAILEAAAIACDRSLLRISLAPLAALDRAESVEVAVRLARAAQLLSAVPVLDAGTDKPDGAVADGTELLIEQLRFNTQPRLVLAPDARRLVARIRRERCHLLHREQPGGASLAHVFAATAADAGLQLSSQDAERLAMTFPLPVDAIEAAVNLAMVEGAAFAAPTDHSQAVSASARRIACPNLPRFARRLPPLFELKDVVLPSDRHAQLSEIVAHVVHASTVLNAWGFREQTPYGRGVAALFWGSSGTGKSMAAQAIARELHTDTYVVDLSRVISKYIGESEKNLDSVFDDAERAGAVLLFDEADALFGKRSEVKDAHDRYANLEVAYLLQRMEAFGGLAILTTNFRQNLDQAFLRRLRFVIEFPKPDASARETIWRQCVPDAAPQGEIDFRFLARRLELTGGNIRQITLRAAFAAAGDHIAGIQMRHIMSATRAELIKLGMQSAERELAEFQSTDTGVTTRAA